MGCHKNIDHDKFPKQGSLITEEKIRVCFQYDTEKSFKAKCLRNDIEEPFKTLFQLEDGRVVEAAECQYTF